MKDRAYRAHKQRNFCDGISEKTIVSGGFNHLYQDMDFRTCVCNFYDKDIHVLMEMEEKYHKFNSLPDLYDSNKLSVHMIDAPAKLIKCFQIIRNYLDLKELARQKKEMSDLKSKKK